MQTIVVTGASGGIGNRVLRMLLNRTPKYEVVAMVRDPQSPSLPSNGNLEVRQADYDAPNQLTVVFANANTLVFISSDGEVEQMKRHHRNVVDAAKSCQVERIIYTSIIDIDEDSPFYYSSVHQYTEGILRNSGVSSIIARTSVFTDFFMRWVHVAVQTGQLRIPAGSGRTSFVTRDDVAASLVALIDEDRRGSIVNITGPTALTMKETTTAIGQVLGRKVDYINIPPESYVEELLEEGRPTWLATAFSSMFVAISEGRFAYISKDVHRLTGNEPTSFESFIAKSLHGST